MRYGRILANLFYSLSGRPPGTGKRQSLETLMSRVFPENISMDK
jgi:hypothetical protein